MELQRLDKYKTEYKDFRSSIDSFEAYLSRAIAGTFGTNFVIVPFDVSTNLHIPELDAIFLLSLAEKEHIVKRSYKVFTDDNTFLDEYDNPKSIPEKIENPETGKMVDRKHFYVDLVFDFANG
jgi:hypothetical protein